MGPFCHAYKNYRAQTGALHVTMARIAIAIAVVLSYAIENLWPSLSCALPRNTERPMSSAKMPVRRSSREPETYTHYQAQVGAQHLNGILTRLWFRNIDVLAEPEAQRNLVPVLRRVMLAYSDGMLYTKLQLAAAMQPVNEKTISKLLQRAAKAGLVEEVRSRLDGRVRWVQPTECLIQEYNKEIAGVIEHIRFLVRDISREPLPKLQEEQSFRASAKLYFPYDVVGKKVISTYKQLARAVALSKGLNEAEAMAAIVDECANLIPVDLRPLAGMAVIAYVDGQFEKAVEHATAALKNDPSEDHVRYFRGTSYFELRQFDKAAADMKVLLDPTRFGQSGNLHFRYAVSLFLIGRRNEAKAVIRQLQTPKAKETIRSADNGLANWQSFMSRQERPSDAEIASLPARYAGERWHNWR